MNPHKPHRLNVVGDFYVVDGCCTACGVPTVDAPTLFSWDEADHCYVSRQPSNSEESTQMLTAMSHAELGCIRYRGQDAAPRRALVLSGDGAQCDKPRWSMRFLHSIDRIRRWFHRGHR
jgi:hypothetical protein